MRFQIELEEWLVKLDRKFEEQKELMYQLTSKNKSLKKRARISFASNIVVTNFYGLFIRKIVTILLDSLKYCNIFLLLIEWLIEVIVYMHSTSGSVAKFSLDADVSNGRHHYVASA